MVVPVHDYPRAPPHLHATGVAGALGDVLHARDFGVMADGVTDDTAALQRAIDSASGTRVVLLPPGTMVVTKPLKLETTEQWAPGLKIQGAGVGVSVLDNRVPNGAAILARTIVKYKFQLGGWIEHLTINSTQPAANSSGIAVEGVYNFRVDSVFVDGMTVRQAPPSGPRGLPLAA